MNTTNDENATPLDRATSARLSRLGAMPVDTSRVVARLRAKIPATRSKASWFRPLRAVAASFVVLATIGAIILSTSSRAVLASPEQLARVHTEMVAGHSSAPVDSVEHARQAIAVAWPKAPTLPDVPDDCVMACGMKSLNKKNTACVLLRNGDIPITMMVADAKDVTMADSPSVVSGGVNYHVNSCGPINMVMAERDGRWLCLIGSISRDRLVEMHSKLR